MPCYVHCSIIFNSQAMEETQVPINRQVDKKWWYIYTTGYYSAVKKNKSLPFVTAWMNLEGIMLREISQKNKANTI